MVTEQPHYSRYLAIRNTFCPVMTREVIDESPRRWMEYYPHESFLELVDKILETMHGGDKPIWVVGNYGTGKTNTALVIQKLFQDDETRVNEWFNKYNDVITQRFPDTYDKLMRSREEKTFVVYDYNGSGIGPDRELIVRLEKTVVKNLKENGYKIPPASPLSNVIERLQEEGEAFERKLDDLREKFQIINQAKTVDDVITILESTAEGNDSTRALSEVEMVLRARDIFLDIDVEGFRNWIARVCEENVFGLVVYIFDEFSDFISKNKENLKTFEQLAESPSLNKFMFIPITHLALEAFRSDTSDSAQKSKDRYNTHKISMPDNIAFELIAHAINKELPEDLEKEWDSIKMNLWASVKDAANKLNVQHSTKMQQTLENMLPIQPMTGYMLTQLSVQIGSNQRSVFDFLSNDRGAGIFKKFIEEGGPAVWGKTILTIDYLWDFFIENESLGSEKEVNEIHSYYLKFRKGGQLKNKTDDDPNIRVLKTILLFVLYSKLTTKGNELLQPTRENIKLSYMGDSSISNIDPILDYLSEISCITVLNDGLICLFTSSVENREAEKRAEELEKKFNLVNDITKTRINEQIKNYLNAYPKNRFEIRVTNPDEVRVPNQPFVDKFGTGEKNEGTICLWFIIAKNNEERLNIDNKITNCFNAEGANCRLAFFSFDDVTFCSSNKNEWHEYVLNLANIELENSDTIKQSRKTYQNNIESAWLDKIVKCDSITLYYTAGGELRNEKISWNQFKTVLRNIDDLFLKNNIDNLIKSPVHGISESNYKGAATAGMTFTTSDNKVKNLMNQFIDEGFLNNPSWFKDNPDHTLTLVHDMIINALESDLKKSRNFSLDKVYNDLKKAPYGFRPTMMTAMALGFCMAELTDGRYQWTDGRITGKLDVDNLGQIIESTLKFSSNNNSKNKKEICRLTPEDQAFIDKAPKMFGIENNANTIEEASGLITQRFEIVSDKVPIWVIPDYVQNIGDPDADVIASTIEDIATAFSISAKGDQEKRSEAIRNVGRRLLDDDRLPEKVIKYIKKEVFQTAFRDYIKTRYPEMNKLSEEVQDYNCSYTDSILNKMVETASFLWKKGNLDENVNQVIEEYRIIKTIKQIASLPSFADFSKSLEVLENGIKESIIPISIIRKKYPQITDIVEGIEQLKKPQPSNIMGEIEEKIERNADVIDSLFFDSAKHELINIVKSNYGIEDIQVESLRTILKNIVQNSPETSISGMTEDRYTELLQQEVEKYRVNSLKNRIRTIWEQKTGSRDIKEWEQFNNMPARYAFPDMSEETFAAIQNPDSYTESRLVEAIEEFNNMEKFDVERSRKKFIEEMVPEQYHDLIDFSDLVQYLKEKNDGPSAWKRNTDLKPLVSKQYRVKIAPKAKQIIIEKNSDELKEKILKAIENNESLGIELLKAIK